MVSHEEAHAATLEYFCGDQIATDVFLSKYALRDNEGNLLEKTPSDMHRRLAREFARIEKKYPNPLDEEKIFSLLEHFKYITPQGSPMSAIGNPHKLQSVSNCFVIDPPHDSYGGILHTDQEQAQIMKRRGGVGFDISNIRPRGIKTANAAGTTDGIAVFMERFSNTCREVAQGGRRGALMLTIDVRHPEIETFINIKRDLKKVTGANISIRLNDEFMHAVSEEKDFQLCWPVGSDEPEIVKTVSAKEIWDQIIDSAWASAEPGLLFWDTATRLTPADLYSDKGFGSISTNPCIVGDTLIAVADGRNAVTIKELAEEGIDVPVYSTNIATGRVEVKTGRAPRKTGEKKEVWRLALGDGSAFIATPDHRVLTKDLEYVNLSDLQPGQAVFSFNTFESTQGRYVCNIDVAANGDVSSFKKQNHEVASVEFYGYEDVYNITVDDNHNYHVITAGDEKFINSSGFCVKNCGEIILSPNDSCRLLLLNVCSYVKNPFTEGAEFDFSLFHEHVMVAQRLMDDLVDIEIEQVEKIIEKVKKDPEPEHVKRIELELWHRIREAAEKGRRTGLGVTAIGDTLAYLNMQYGSEDSIQMTEKIYRALAVAAHESSVMMATERGAFPAYEHGRTTGHEFMERLFDASADEVNELYKKHGRRNICLTTTAPAGSVSCLTQTTSGIEPAYLLSYKRRKKINPNDKNVRVDFVDDLGDRWQEYTVYHHGFKKWMDVTGHADEDVSQSPYFKATSNDVDWLASVKIQAAAQKWVEHAISKTCNLPADATKELVSEVYVEAWRQGCKGFTVYRDGCRTGVLVSTDEKKDDGNEDRAKFVQRSAPKRPKELPCKIHHTQIKGETWTILVGLFDDKPFEVFGGLSKFVEIPKKYTDGVLIKHDRKSTNSVYDLRIGEDGFVIKNVIEQFDNPNYSHATRLISLSLRHGCEIQFVVEQLQKEKDADMFSFSKCVSRVLKQYIKDGTKANIMKKCPNCEATDKFAYQEGCIQCLACGWSRC